MPWYPAPARFAAATYRHASSENRCQPIAGEDLLPASRPGTAGRRVARAGHHPKAGKTEIARFAGRGPAAGLFHAAARGSWPPAGPASAPCPCHESRRSSGQGTFTRPHARTCRGRRPAWRRGSPAPLLRRPGAQNCRSRATGQPSRPTGPGARSGGYARSRIDIRCARPRSVTGRKLRAAGQTIDAAHASVVPSKARCSLGSVSARVEIHGLDRPRPLRRSAWSGQSPDLHNACPPGPPLAPRSSP